MTGESGVERANGARFPRFVAVRCRLPILALALLLGTSTTALGSHAPSPSTGRAIVTAIRRDRGLGSPGDYLVVSIRVSSRGPYARASTRPRNRTVSYQGQLVILRRSRGAWRVIDFGTAGVGCGLPSAVQRDLNVTPPAAYCQKR